MADFFDAVADELSTQRFHVTAQSSNFDVSVERVDITPKYVVRRDEAPTGLRVIGEATGYLAVETRIAVVAELSADLEFYAGPAMLVESSILTDVTIDERFVVEFRGDIEAGRVQLISAATADRPLKIAPGNVDAYLQDSDLL